jgi:hypothetical protein
MIDMLLLLLLLHAPKCLNDQPIASISQFTTLLEKDEAKQEQEQEQDD